jgi:hypothetical protein
MTDIVLRLSHKYLTILTSPLRVGAGPILQVKRLKFKSMLKIAQLKAAGQNSSS